MVLKLKGGMMDSYGGVNLGVDDLDAGDFKGFIRILLLSDDDGTASIFEKKTKLFMISKHKIYNYTFT